MTPQERQRRVAQLLDLVVHLAAAERDEVLRRECEGDLELYTDVQQRLVGGAGNGSLDSPAEPAAGRTPSGLSSGMIERLASHRPKEPRYELVSEVAQGGMGAIFKVWDQDLRRSLAMKVALQNALIHEDPSQERSLGRFLEEAQVTGQLDHPGVVPVHELGVDGAGRVFFTMRLVRGRDLKEIIEEFHAGKKEWTQTRLINVLSRVCETMAYAHSKSVIHRDIKPGNIMVGRFGEVYVMDWGLARVEGRIDPNDIRLMDASSASISEVRTDREDARGSDQHSPLMTMDGAIVGTPYFMPPEQARGEIENVGRHSDVYAVGTMLYHLLTKRVPYSTPDGHPSPFTVLAMVVSGPPRSVRSLAPDASAELEAICNKAMAREPSDRYSDMSELGDDLRAYLEGRVVRAHQTGVWAELKKWVGRNRVLAIAVAAATLILVLGSTVSSLMMASKNRELTDQAQELEVQSYRTAIAAADGALSENDVVSARRYLEQADPRQRDWEWYYLAGRTDQSESTLFGHTGAVAVVASSRDGERVASFALDETVRIWGAESGAELAKLPVVRTTGVLDAARPPVGSFDAALTVFAEVVDQAGGSGSNVRVWDLAGGEPELIGSSEPVVDVAVSPDGARIAGASDAIRVWDVDTREIAFELRSDRASGFRSVAYDARGRWIAGVDRANALWIWDAASGALRTGPIADQACTGSVAFRPDGKKIAVASENIVLVLDADTGRLDGRLVGHDAPVQSLSFHPSGHLLASAGKDATIRVWGVDSLEEVDTLLGHREACTAVFSGDGSRLFSAARDWTVKTWRTPDLERRLPRQGRKQTSDFDVFGTSDGERIAFRRKDRVVEFWDLHGGEDKKDAEVPAPAGAPTKFTRYPWGRALSPNGERFAQMLEDGKIGIWETRTGRLAHTFEGHDGRVHGLAYHPDGHLLASAGDDGTARIWSTSREPMTLDGHGAPVRCVAFDSGGEHLLTGGDDGTIRVWDAREQKLLRSIPDAGGSIWSICSLADGERIATLTWPGHGVFALDFWDVSGEPAVRSRVDVFSGWARSKLVRNGAGTRFVVSRIYDFHLPVFDGRTGEKLIVLRADWGPNNGTVGFSGPNGDRLVTYDAFGQLVEFDASNGRELEARLELRASAQVTELLDDLFERNLFRSKVLGPLCAMGELDATARRAAIEAVLDDPRTELSVFNGLGHRLAAAGRSEAEYAVDLVVAKRLCELKPGDSSARKLRGFAELRTGKPEAALTSLAALTRHPTARGFAALAHLQRGDRDGARREIERARELIAEGISTLGASQVADEAERLLMNMR
ncbi:MAG: protein kinase [bacterium]|nr:protein kinase [bacterium]